MQLRTLKLIELIGWIISGVITLFVAKDISKFAYCATLLCLLMYILKDFARV